MENVGPEAMEMHLPERWAVLEQALREMNRQDQRDQSGGQADGSRTVPEAGMSPVIAAAA